MTQTLLGVFKYTDDAERALSALTDLGYEPNEISVVMKDIRKAREILQSKDTGWYSFKK